MSMGIQVVSPYIWPFPTNYKETTEIGMEGYRLFSKAILAWTTVTLVYRGIAFLSTGTGAARFSELIKDLCFYSVSVSIVPEILQTVGKASADLARSIANSPYSHYAQNVGGGLKGGSFFDIWKSFSSLDWLIGAADLIPSTVWWATAGISEILLAVQISLTPLFLYLNLIARVGHLSTLAVSYLTLYLWPVCWNMCGFVGTQLAQRANGSGSFVLFIFSCVILMLQLFSPIWFALRLRGQGMGGSILAGSWIGSMIGGRALEGVRRTGGVAHGFGSGMMKQWNSMGNRGGVFKREWVNPNVQKFERIRKPLDGWTFRGRTDNQITGNRYYHFEGAGKQSISAHERLRLSGPCHRGPLPDHGFSGFSTPKTPIQPHGSGGASINSNRDLQLRVSSAYRSGISIRGTVKPEIELKEGKGGWSL